MTFALEIPAVLIALGALAVGLALGVAWQSRRARARALSNDAASSPDPHEVAMLRSLGLDVVGEAVIILDADRLVRDCNSAALALLDRQRSSIESESASSLRRFEALDQDDPLRVAAEHGVWMGEAWVRQPDGASRLCQAKVMAIRDSAHAVVGYAEAYRDVVNERAMDEEFRNLLYGVRLYSAATTLPDASLRAIREELRLLGEAFHGLDRVIRQYERLLPSLSADDPLSEAIAGAAYEAREAMSQVGVPGLLDEIPRSLSRLRAHLQRLSELLIAAGATTPSDDPAPKGESAVTTRTE